VTSTSSGCPARARRGGELYIDAHQRRHVEGRRRQLAERDLNAVVAPVERVGQDGVLAVRRNGVRI
jgi:hypothetical protein